MQCTTNPNINLSEFFKINHLFLRKFEVKGFEVSLK